MSNDPYRRIAAYYDAAVERANRPLRAIGLRMVPPEPGMTVLDVGCGTGTQLALYPGCRLHGIDASPAMLGRARLRLGEGADLVLGDATRMPYPDAMFDLVTTVLVLHELPAPVRRAILAEIARVIAPTGRALVIDYGPGPLRSPGGRLRRALSYVPELVAGREHLRNFRAFVSGGGLPAQLSGAALHIVQERLVGEGNMGLYVLAAG